MLVTGNRASAENPGRLASKYDLLRYRWRVLSYRLGLLRTATPYEWLGIGLGIVGALSALGAGFRIVVVGLGASVAFAISGLIASLAVAAVSYLLSRKPALFKAAARDRRTTERMREDMRAGIQNEHARDAIEQMYSPIIGRVNRDLALAGTKRRFDFIAAGASKGPCLAVVMPAVRGEALGGLLSPEWKPRSREWALRNSSFAAERQLYMRRLRDLGPHQNPLGDEEGDNLILDEVVLNPVTGFLNMHVSIGTYGQIVRTSDALLNEFALFGYIGRDRSDELRPWSKALARIPLLRVGKPVRLNAIDALRQLPWRRQVHEWAGSPSNILLRPVSRAAGLGVAVTMLKRGAAEPTAYVARRSSKVGTYPDVLHVLPSGMCNAKQDYRSSKEALRPDFLHWTMVGELLEECYDVEELAVYRTEDWVGHIRQQCAEKGINAASPVFTGLAFDLLTLRPEVCSLVEVAEPAAPGASANFQLCWEYSPMHGVTTMALSRVTDLCDRTDFVQSGLASLALASLRCSADVAREAEGKC
jgi:hypothetical protein